MKILFCTSSLMLNGGGISSYANDFINAFKDLFEICVVTSDKYENDTASKPRVLNVDLFNLTYKNAESFIALIKKEKPNVIFNSNAPLLSIVSKFIPKDIRIITVSHFISGRLAHVAGFNSKSLNTIISLSHFGKDYLRKTFNINEDNKLEVVYNFLPNVLNAENLIEEKGKKETLTIVYPGGTALHKSPFEVLQVAKLLSRSRLKFKFYWLGSTLLPGHNIKFLPVKNLKNLIKDKRIVFTGNTSRTQAVALIENANIFLLPSKGEGCAITLVEAMRAGCIPIVSNAPHASCEIVKNNQNGFVYDVSDVKGMATRIEEILDSHSKYTSFYKKSQQTFISLLEEERWKKNMLEILVKPITTEYRHPLSRLSFLKAKLCLQILFLGDRIQELIRSLLAILKFNFFKNGY